MEIRGLEEEDEEGIRSLFALCFGKELSPDEWIWKYKASPWGGTAAIAVDDGEIIAHYGGLKMKFSFQGKTFDVFQPCDVMTHPKFRARIFSKKGAMVKAGEYFYNTNPMDFAFGFPSERHAILGTKQLGYTEHGYVTVLTKKVSGSGRGWGPFSKVQTGWDSMSGAELDSMWEEVKNAAGLTICKNSSYLFWRYRDNPSRQYLPVVVRSGFRKRPMAFGVLSFRGSELLVQDFFCTGAMNIRNLLRLFEGIALEHGLESLVVWVNIKEPSFGTFMDYGFVTGKGIPYIFRIINAAIRPEFLFDNYRYRMGDYDAS